MKLWKHAEMKTSVPVAAFAAPLLKLNVTGLFEIGRVDGATGLIGLIAASSVAELNSSTNAHKLK